jgi:hypothetical protein
MAWRLCDTPRCGMKIRTGLVRMGTGVDGQKLLEVQGSSRHGPIEAKEETVNELPKNDPENVSAINRSIAEYKKRQRDKFLWWFIPRLLGMTLLIGASTLAVSWMVHDFINRQRVQCLEYNGPLLNACLQNCSLSPKITHIECEDFCEKAACKSWTQ